MRGTQAASSIKYLPGNYQEDFFKYKNSNVSKGECRTEEANGALKRKFLALVCF